MNIFIKIGLVVSFGLLGGRVARKFNLPDVTGFLIGGLFLGPSFLNIITDSDTGMINFINELALSAIAFNIGGEFIMKQIKKLGKKIFIIAVFEVLVVVFLVFGVMFYLLNQPFVFSVMVASMSAATAPAGTMMVIRQYRAKGPLTNTILPVAALDDALGIMVFGLAMSLAKISLGEVTGGGLALAAAPFIEIALSLVIGSVLGVILSYSSKFVKSSEEMTSLILVFILSSSGLAQVFELSSLLSSMMMGAVFVNISKKPLKVFSNINQFMPPFNLLFFALAGSSLDLSVLSSIGLLGLAFVLSRMFGKVIGSTMGAYVAKSEPVVKKYLGWALLPQGGISIGLSMVVKDQLPALSDGIVTLILFSVLVFEIAGPILAKVAITKAGEVNVGA